ncbi:MAG: hypothetical protein K9G62_05885 [Alphaproteobacteria bacterium]|nr:hypothetical protein [Alphaproteobacteria bacterium]
MSFSGYRAAFNNVAKNTGFGFDPSAPDEKNDQSLMQKLLPDQSFQPKNVIKPAELKVDTRNAVTPGALKQKQEDTKAARADVQESKAALTTAWDAAKGEASAAIKDAATSMGHDPNQALASFLPGEQNSDATFGMSLAIDSAMAGSGSLATMGMQAGSAVNEIHAAAKKLPPDQVEAIAAQALARLSKDAEDRKLTALTSGAQGMPQEKSKHDFQWKNLNPKDLQELMAADIESQPEMKLLENLENGLAEAEQTHAYAAEHKNDLSGNKLEVALETGDQKWVKGLTGADETVVAAYMSDTPETAPAPAPAAPAEPLYYDAASVSMFSASLTDIGGTLKMSAPAPIPDSFKAALSNEPDMRALLLKPTHPSLPSFS